MSERHKHKGQCHCGNIRFTFETTVDVAELVLRRCDCSFCRKHGSRYTSDPDGILSIQIKDEKNINRYHFGHKTADFIICTTCGALPFVTSDIDNKTYAVLNVNCLDRVDQLQDNSREISLGTEIKEDRLTRRRKNWIGTVAFSA